MTVEGQCGVRKIVVRLGNFRPAVTRSSTTGVAGAQALLATFVTTFSPIFLALNDATRCREGVDRGWRVAIRMLLFLCLL